MSKEIKIDDETKTKILDIGEALKERIGQECGSLSDSYFVLNEKIVNIEMLQITELLRTAISDFMITKDNLEVDNLTFEAATDALHEQDENLEFGVKWEENK